MLGILYPWKNLRLPCTQCNFYTIFYHQGFQVDWSIFFWRGREKLFIFDIFQYYWTWIQNFLYGQPISMLISYGNESNLIWWPISFFFCSGLNIILLNFFDDIPCKLLGKKSPLSLFFLLTKYFDHKWESRLFASTTFLKKKREFIFNNFSSINLQMYLNVYFCICCITWMKFNSRILCT